MTTKLKTANVTLKVTYYPSEDRFHPRLWNWNGFLAMYTGTRIGEKIEVVKPRRKEINESL